MLDPWSLRILVAVADGGSFSAAAEALTLTQPAVSRQIAGLERRFGVPLFRRVPRGVVPTTAGEVAVRLAREVTGQLDAFEATMRSFAGLDGGRLRLAGFASVNTSLVPTAIRRYREAHPGVTVSLHHVEPFDAVAAVREGRLDLALVTAWQLTDDPWAARTDPAALVPPEEVTGVDLVPLADEELLVGLPADHRLARRRRVPLSELGDERWVEGAPPDCIGPIPQLAETLGTEPDVAFHCDDWNGKHALVAGGAGIMVVPASAAASVRPDVVLRPTTPALGPRPLYVATPRPPFCGPPAAAMVALLRELAPEATRPVSRRRGGRRTRG